MFLESNIEILELQITFSVFRACMLFCIFHQPQAFSLDHHCGRLLKKASSYKILIHNRSKYCTCVRNNITTASILIGLISPLFHDTYLYMKLFYKVISLLIYSTFFQTILWPMCCFSAGIDGPRPSTKINETYYEISNAYIDSVL